MRVAGGTYTTSATGSRYVPALNPANSGSANSPITIRAEGQVSLRLAGGNGPVIGSYQRNYVHWQGFSIDERTAPVHADTGPIVIWSSTGVVVDGCEVLGIAQSYGDNHNGVRLENARDAVVRNCKIIGIRGTNTSAHNSAGIMLYGSGGVLLENNEIENCGARIFPKGADNFDITIRRNRIGSSTKGIRTSYSSPSAGVNSIYQNIIENGSDIGNQIAENSHNWTVANNTLVNVPNGIWLRNATTTGNLRVGNNLVVGSVVAINAGEWQGAYPGVGRNLYSGVQGVGATWGNLPVAEQLAVGRADGCTQYGRRPALYECSNRRLQALGGLASTGPLAGTCLT